VEVKMNRIIFAAVALVFLSLGQQQATADYYQEAPWCAVLDMGKGVYWDCQYRSFEQCRPTVLAGNRGWCNLNPYFIPNGVLASQHYGKRHTRSQ